MDISIISMIWQALVTVLCILFAVKLRKMEDRVENRIEALFTALLKSAGDSAMDIDDLRNYITVVESENKERLAALNDKYEQAEEMMQQVRNAAEEAAETEKKMQDGIAEIINYNGLEKIISTINFKD